MENKITNRHHETALKVFREMIIAGENRIKMMQIDESENSRMHTLMDMAMFHIIVGQSAKAELELKEAVKYYKKNANADEQLNITYTVYILRLLSGIHESLGCKNEAATEDLEANTWEAKLKMGDALLATSTFANKISHYQNHV